MPQSADSVSYIDQLQTKLNRQWTAIQKARLDSGTRRTELRKIFSLRNSPDTSLVVFGSVARAEVTGSSDLDWILLVDASALPEHKAQELSIQGTLADKKLIKPGKSGVFGKMVGSHDLVHEIGGEDDLNSNTTRRVLLLLESLPVDGIETYRRVRRQILRRYFDDDRGLFYGSGDVRIPRFMLNDFTRYWRTVTVDFVYKQVADRDQKWALRNAKLRMSRKLVFASGLLQCFFCHLDPKADEARRALRTKDNSVLTEYFETELSMPPLETLAKACLIRNIKPETASNIFDNYDRFLAILDDEPKRDDLELAQSHDALRSSAAWREVSEVSRPFHRGLVSLFLRDDNELRDLTMEYGIF